MDMNVKEFASKIEEMELKSKKYDDIKEELENVVNKINEKFSEIQELLSELAPTMTIRKSHSGGSWGNITVGYVEKCYRYLIENKGESFSITQLKEAVGLEGLRGGSEYKVKQGVAKLKDVIKSRDPNYLKRDIFTYTGSQEIPEDLTRSIKERINENKKGDIQDVPEIEDEEKIKFEKTSHMG